MKVKKVYVYLSFYPFTSYEYLLICILDKNYYTPNTENVQEELFYHSPTLGMPSFVDHLGAVRSSVLGNPRRVRHVPEQISVERKFVEECAVLFPSQNNRPPPRWNRIEKTLEGIAPESLFVLQYVVILR